MTDKRTLTPRSFVDSAGKTVNLVRVAIALRRLQVCLLLFLANLGAFTVFKVNGYPQFSGPAAGLAIVFGFALVVLQFRLSMACGGRLGEALCFLLVTPLFPPIFIVWFGGYNYEARTALRRTGVLCGLLGVHSKDMLRLYEGVCPACGYDLTELRTATVCPECGNPIESPTTRDTHIPASPV